MSIQSRSSAPPPPSRPKLVVVHSSNVASPRADATASARKILSGALLRAMAETGATQVDVAKWCKVTERTVRSWLNDPESRGVDARAVMNSKRLRIPFARALLSLLAEEGNRP